MLFRVVSGKYRDGDKVYKTGEIVDSEKELDKTFKNAFERVDENKSEQQKKVQHFINIDLDEPKPAIMEKQPEAEKVVPELVEVEPGKWNVVNKATGENINDFPLTENEAKQIKALFAGEVKVEKPVRHPVPRHRKNRKRAKRSINLVDM